MATQIIPIVIGYNVEPETLAIYTRIQGASGGFTMTPDQVLYLNNKVVAIKTANSNVLPAFWYDAAVSVDYGNILATKVFNLGTAGASGDGTMTNGQVSSMTAGSDLNKYFSFTSASSQSIQTTYPTQKTGTWFSVLRPSAAAAERVVFGTSGNAATVLQVTNLQRLQLERAFQAAIATSTASFSTSTWNTFGFSFNSGTDYALNLNLNADATGTTTDSYVARNLRIGEKIGTSFYDGSIQSLAIFDTVMNNTLQNTIQDILKGSLT